MIPQLINAAQAGLALHSRGLEMDARMVYLGGHHVLPDVCWTGGALTASYDYVCICPYDKGSWLYNIQLRNNLRRPIDEPTTSTS